MRVSEGYCRFEGNFYHIGKTSLAGFCVKRVSFIYMVGYGTDSEGFFTRSCGVGLQGGGLHLYGQNSHFAPGVVVTRAVGIEEVGGKKISHKTAYSRLAAFLGGNF